jgi:Peptidase family M23
MARRYWTVLFLPDDDGPVRQVRVSRDLIRVVTAAVLIGLGLLGSAAASYAGHSTGSAVASSGLVQENQLLRKQIGQMQQRSQTLDAVLDTLARQDQEFRLVAGLQPLSGDVMEAGIGGPGTETLSDDRLYRMDPAAGRMAFSTSSGVETLLRRAKLLSDSWSEAYSTLRSEEARLASTPSIMPAQGYISSGFTRSRLNPILNITRPHEGIDIAAPVGTPIRATANGVVTFVGWDGEYGLLVEIDHGHGFSTRYAHASRIVVKEGQYVSRGQKIAEVGETGLAVGPHVHYEVRVNGVPQDPEHYILAGFAIPE